MLRTQGIFFADAKPTPQSRLLFVEGNRKEVFCIWDRKVESILYQMHDSHGHFTAGVLLRTIMGRYYRPSWTKDVNLYSASYPSCRMVGLLKLSVSQLAIVQPPTTGHDRFWFCWKVSGDSTRKQIYPNRCELLLPALFSGRLLLTARANRLSHSWRKYSGNLNSHKQFIQIMVRTCSPKNSLRC